MSDRRSTVEKPKGKDVLSDWKLRVAGAVMVGLVAVTMATNINGLDVLQALVTPQKTEAMALDGVGRTLVAENSRPWGFHRVSSDGGEESGRVGGGHVAPKMEEPGLKATNKQEVKDNRTVSEISEEIVKLGPWKVEDATDLIRSGRITEIEAKGTLGRIHHVLSFFDKEVVKGLSFAVNDNPAYAHCNNGHIEISVDINTKKAIAHEIGHSIQQDLEIAVNYYPELGKYWADFLKAIEMDAKAEGIRFDPNDSGDLQNAKEMWADIVAAGVLKGEIDEPLTFRIGDNAGKAIGKMLDDYPIKIAPKLDEIMPTRNLKTGVKWVNGE